MQTATHTKEDISLYKTNLKEKILLVDDNEIIRIYFRDVFWIHGLEDKYDLTICKNIEEAEKVVENKDTMPDIVFSGLVMPMKDKDKIVVSAEAGFHLLKKIKSSPKLKHIKVVIFSGYGEKKYRDRATELGVDSFLVKHENMPRELVEFIEHINLK